jgi:hypothetical protein
MKVLDYVAFFFLAAGPRICLAFAFAMTSLIAVASLEDAKPKVEWAISDVQLENCEVDKSLRTIAVLNCKIIQSE